MKQTILFICIIITYAFSYAQTFTTIELPDSVNSTSRDVAQDLLGNFWYVGEGCLVKMDSDFNILNYYTDDNSGLPHFTARSVAVDLLNHIWVGTEGGGLARFDGNETWTTFSPYPFYDVRVIKVNSFNHVWFHSWDKGIVQYDGSNFNMYYTNNSSIPTNYTMYLEIQNDTIIWIGTIDSGVVKFSNEQFTVYDTVNSNIGSNIIYGIKIDTINNIVYCGTDDGIYLLDGNIWQKLDCFNKDFQFKKSKPLLVDSDNHLWFVTETQNAERLLIRHNGYECISYSNEEIGCGIYSLSPQRYRYNSMIEISKSLFLLNCLRLILIDFNTNVETNDIKTRLSIYPNPTRDVVHFSSDNRIIESIKMFTLDGKLLSKISTINLDYFEINIEDFAPKKYLVIVEFTDKTIEYKTLIKY